MRAPHPYCSGMWLSNRAPTQSPQFHFVNLSQLSIHVHSTVCSALHSTWFGGSKWKRDVYLQIQSSSVEVRSICVWHLWVSLLFVSCSKSTEGAFSNNIQTNCCQKQNPNLTKAAPKPIHSVSISTTLIYFAENAVRISETLLQQRTFTNDIRLRWIFVCRHKFWWHLCLQVGCVTVKHLTKGNFEHMMLILKRFPFQYTADLCQSRWTKLRDWCGAAAKRWYHRWRCVHIEKLIGQTDAGVQHHRKW